MGCADVLCEWVLLVCCVSGLCVCVVRVGCAGVLREWVVRVCYVSGLCRCVL